jgi:hypothetical protein
VLGHLVGGVVQNGLTRLCISKFLVGLASLFVFSAKQIGGGQVCLHVGPVGMRLGSGLENGSRFRIALQLNQGTPEIHIAVKVVGLSLEEVLPSRDCSFKLCGCHQAHAKHLGNRRLVRRSRNRLVESFDSRVDLLGRKQQSAKQNPGADELRIRCCGPVESREGTLNIMFF